MSVTLKGLTALSLSFFESAKVWFTSNKQKCILIGFKMRTFSNLKYLKSGDILQSLLTRQWSQQSCPCVCLYEINPSCSHYCHFNWAIRTVDSWQFLSPFKMYSECLHYDSTLIWQISKVSIQHSRKWKRQVECEFGIKSANIPLRRNDYIYILLAK